MPPDTLAVELTRFPGHLNTWAAKPGKESTVPRKSTNPNPLEYRAEAMRLVREGGRSVRDVADNLGVSQESLRIWLKQADLDAGRRPATGPNSPH